MTNTPLEQLAQWVGQSVDAIDTPALVVDLDAMGRNLTRMAQFAQKSNVALRPHAKMHKSALLAHWQMQAGAVGVCVQKTSEAETLAAAGVSNLYISNQVVGHAKLERVAALAEHMHHGGGQLAIAVDSIEGVERLAHAMQGRSGEIDVYVEVNVGQNRCGVAPGAPALLLAQAVRQHAGLRYAGLQAYHGSAQHLRSVAERRAAIAQVATLIQHTRMVFATVGLALGRVTGGGTGSFALEAASGQFQEIQPGSYLFMDADYARNERDPAQPHFEQALFVKTQVMSVGADHAVCDAGHKSHAVDSGLPTVWPACWSTELSVIGCSDEHTVLQGAVLPGVGQTLWLVPGHCDPTVNLHDHLVGVRGGLFGGTVERLIRVDGRGALT